MTRPTAMRTLPAVACGLLLTGPATAAPPVDYNTDVRPILAAQCFTCHGPDAKTRKADLRLDLRDEAVKSGAVVPGKPADSPFLQRLTAADPTEVMPPPRAKKPPLTPAQLDTLKRWVAEGARYGDHWAFAKLARPAVPGPGHPVDAFIGARLAAEGVTPQPEADRVALLRRLSFDLTGLPPTAGEVAAFVADTSPDAYERQVDRLLASPHHGERMAVWWLDLVRYADSIGYHSDNPMNVAPYRDYVIKAFNENLPFDRFTVEQLAGDLLPSPTTEQRVATAYNRLLQTTEEGGAQAKEYEAKYAADRVRNFGQVWLGGTLMCAECHDHKFDPYTQKDFYTVAAFFADVQEAGVGRREDGMRVPSADQERRLQELADAATAADRRYKARAAVLGAFAVAADRDAAARAEKARDDFDRTLPRTLVTTAGQPRTTRVLARGNWLDTTGPVVTPATPGFLPPMGKLDPKARPTRLDLARWTVSPDNPLTGRVTVNRLWKLAFGRGIARSLEESGTQGELPTHPELLDWLAAEFQKDWDVKRLLRLLVTSAAYRRSSAEPPALREKDPRNTLFARQARFRLDAEFVRDNSLAVSGLLNRQVGGASVKPYQPAGYWSALNFPTREWQKDGGAKVYRRGLYTHWQRTFPHPAMVAFDAPSREECTCDRPRSNVPQQALVLLNDPVFVEAAKALAAKTLAEGGAGDTARLGWLFRRATGRGPTPAEAEVLLGVLAKHRAEYATDPAAAAKLLAVGDLPPPKDVPPAELAAWANVARVALNLHETITRP